MKFCANLSFMFSETTSLIERYALAKQAGFKHVESGFPYGCDDNQVVDAKNKSGLNQVLVNLLTGDVSKGELGVTFVPGCETEFKQNLSTTIDLAKKLKCSLLHVMAGNVDGDRTDEQWRTYEANLKYAAGLLQRENIVGVIEPINNHTVPKYFMSSYDKAIEIIKRINSPNLKLMMDIFHLQQIRGDISHSIKELLPYIGHVQIAQVPNRNEPDTPGEIDYRYVLKTLENSGYDGFIGLEYKPVKGTTEGLKWITDFGYSLDE